MHTNGVIVKVGTDVLKSESGTLNLERVLSISQQMAALNRAKISTALVSSGAKLAGESVVNDKIREKLAGMKTDQARRQFLTMIGQVPLMSAYADALKYYDIIVGQALLVDDDFRNPEHSITMQDCLRDGFNDPDVLPIVNGNDVIGLREYATDNDKLTRLLSNFLKPDTVFLLTSPNGVHERAPQEGDDTGLIRNIDPSSFNIDSVRFGDNNSNGTGGMKSKLNTALELARDGIRVFITSGKRQDIIRRCLEGDQNIPYTCVSLT